MDIFVINGWRFSATLVAPWFLNKTLYEFNFLSFTRLMIVPKMIWVFLLPQKWHLLDQGWRQNGHKIGTFKFLKKKEMEISTLVVRKVPRHDFFGSILVWHIVRALPKLILAHLAIRRALEPAQMVIECYFLRVKKSPKDLKKSRTNFFGFFCFLWLKH